MFFRRFFYFFYQKAARKMCSEIKDFIKEGEKVLDLGCGSGIFSQELRKNFKVKILGIDIIDQRIEKIPFFIFNGRKIPFPENSFDTVVISFVLHHTKDPEEILREAKRVAKKIIIFEDIPKGIFGKIRCWIHFLSWNLFFGESPRFNFFGEEEWEKIFKRNNLKLRAKKSFVPDFYFLDPIKREIFILEK